MAMLVKHRFDGNALDTNAALHGTVTSTTFGLSSLLDQGEEAVFNGTTSKIVSGLQMVSQTAATFSAWIKPVSGNGYIMGQHNGSTEGIGLELNSDRTVIDERYDSTRLLCHFDKSFADSSLYGHILPYNNNAQPTISAAQSTLGFTKSALHNTPLSFLYVSSAGSGITGTGDFTIDFWIYRTVAGVQHVLYDQRNSANGLYPAIYIAADNTLRYYVSSLDRITGGAVTNNQWVHIALVRYAGSTVLYMDGVAQGSPYADANSYLNGATRPVIGCSGFNATQDTYKGHMQELRVRDGAEWTAAFTPPTVPYKDYGTVDARIRGTLNGLTTAWYPIIKSHHTQVTLSYDAGVLSLYRRGAERNAVCYRCVACNTVHLRRAA
jgi:hypothetical protein